MYPLSLWLCHSLSLPLLPILSYSNIPYISISVSVCLPFSLALSITVFISKPLSTLCSFFLSIRLSSLSASLYFHFSIPLSLSLSLSCLYLFLCYYISLILGTEICPSQCMILSLTNSFYLCMPLSVILFFSCSYSAPYPSLTVFLLLITMLLVSL